MGFFKDFKDDFSQAVNELMPGEDNLEDGAANEDLVVNTLENEVDVESELSKLDGLLEQVTSQTAKQQTSVQNQPVPSAPQPQPAGDPGKSCEKHSGGKKNGRQYNTSCQ